MTTKKITQQICQKLEKIAKSEIGLETPQERGRDHLNFPECSVLGIMDALKRAYWLGVETE